MLRYCCFRRKKMDLVYNNEIDIILNQEEVILKQFDNPNPEINIKNHNVDGNDIKWEDTVEFTFPIQGGRVIKVYDADTITIATKLPFETSKLYRIAVRLNGIDAPEIKGKGISDEEKEMAIKARDFVSNLVMNKYIKLENIKNEKYGRILADVYIENTHLNQLLLDERYAVKYDGGTKIKPNSWKEYKSSGII